MLLRTYQLWLHDLYPRAKFNDGLTMIEKLGHTKSIQRLRCGWINESKPNTDGTKDSDEDNISETVVPGGNAVDPAARQSNLSPDINAAAGANNLQEVAQRNDPTMESGFSGEDVGIPDIDDLEALLAEEPTQTGKVQDRTSSRPAGLSHAPSTRAENLDEDFAHEEDIMRELDMWD